MQLPSIPPTECCEFSLMANDSYSRNRRIFLKNVMWLNVLCQVCSQKDNLIGVLDCCCWTNCWTWCVLFLCLRFWMKMGQYRTMMKLMTGSKKMSRPEHSSTRQWSWKNKQFSKAVQQHSKCRAGSRQNMPYFQLKVNPFCGASSIATDFGQVKIICECGISFFGTKIFLLSRTID